MSRMIVSIAVALIVIYVGLALLLYVSQHRLLFHPDYPTRRLVNTPADIGLAYEDVHLHTEDSVMLHAWYVPGATRATVLFFHGNAGNISHRLSTIQLLHELRMSVFIIDYRGYGASEGEVDEPGTYYDAEAAWQYLTRTRGRRPEEIIVFGRSLGGAIAAWLAQKHTPAAVIIESGFTSVPAVAAKLYPYFPVGLLSRYSYPTVEYIVQVRCPVLIMQSRDDELVPYQHGLQLYEKAGGPKDFLEIFGTHNQRNLQLGDNYAEGIRRFVSRLVIASFNETL